MGRPGDADAYLRLIARLRQAMPDIALRSTFLLGFPGETDQAFQRLLDFLEDAQLDRVGAFTYSPEPGSQAAAMPNQVPASLAQERYHQLMTLQQRISLARNQRWVGREMEVLIESPGESPDHWIGRSFRDAPDIDGAVILVGQELAPAALPLRSRLRTPSPLPVAQACPESNRRVFNLRTLRAGAFLPAAITSAGPYDLTAEA
jgi:ribosomal protein S12 methylthiotransferase